MGCAVGDLKGGLWGLFSHRQRSKLHDLHRCALGMIHGEAQGQRRLCIQPKMISKAVAVSRIDAYLLRLAPPHCHLSAQTHLVAIGDRIEIGDRVLHEGQGSLGKGLVLRTQKVDLVPAT